MCRLSLRSSRPAGSGSAPSVFPPVAAGGTCACACGAEVPPLAVAGPGAAVLRMRCSGTICSARVKIEPVREPAAPNEGPGLADGVLPPEPALAFALALDPWALAVAAGPSAPGGGGGGGEAGRGSGGDGGRAVAAKLVVMVSGASLCAWGGGMGGCARWSGMRFSAA